MKLLLQRTTHRLQEELLTNLSADDYAPPAAKTQWLAVFYLCIPTGYALGYIFGGLVAVPLGWRAPFLLEALAMIPFILYCSFAPPIDIRGTKDKGTVPFARAPIWIKCELILFCLGFAGGSHTSDLSLLKTGG